MMGLGTLANVLAILAGGGLGLLLKGGLPERWQGALMRTMGLAVVFIGAAGAMPGLLRAEGGALAGTGVKDTLGMIFALALGTLVGEWIDLDDKMERLGAWLKAKADRGGDSQFVQGFVTASLTVCIGAMAVVGSIQDGLSHDPSTLLTKAALDCLIVMVFAATYGKGALFSALPVGVFQGSITLLAGLLAPVFSPAVVDNLSFLGSILIFCVGANLAFDTKLRVANMLPALVFGGLWTTFI